MAEVDEYLAKLSSPERNALEHVREIVHETVPDAVEVITYGMPGFKYKGKYLLAFNAFKEHMSVFPGAKPTSVLRDKLKNYKLSKGTIQFTLESPIPDSLLKEIIQIRVDEINNR